MSLTVVKRWRRRAAVLASSLAKPPSRQGADPGRLSSGAHRSVVVHRRRDQSRKSSWRCRRCNAAGGIDGPAGRTDHPRHPERSDEGRERRGRADARQKVSVVLVRSIRRVAGGRAAARAREDAQVASCWFDTLTDPKKYPTASQPPTNAADRRRRDAMWSRCSKRKKVAVISDTTGYGTASVNAYVPMLKGIGAEVVYQGNVDAANPDLKPELLRMQSAGAEAIMPWSVNAGFLSRIIDTRGQMHGRADLRRRARWLRHRPRRCWTKPSTRPRSIPTISARFATPPAAS